MSIIINIIDAGIKYHSTEGGHKQGIKIHHWHRKA